MGAVEPQLVCTQLPTLRLPTPPYRLYLNQAPLLLLFSLFFHLHQSSSWYVQRNHAVTIPRLQLRLSFRDENLQDTLLICARLQGLVSKLAMGYATAQMAPGGMLNPNKPPQHQQQQQQQGQQGYGQQPNYGSQQPAYGAPQQQHSYGAGGYAAAGAAAGAAGACSGAGFSEPLVAERRLTLLASQLDTTVEVQLLLLLHTVKRHLRTASHLNLNLLRNTDRRVTTPRTLSLLSVSHSSTNISTSLF